MGQWQFGGLFSVAACQGCSLVEPDAGSLAGVLHSTVCGLARVLLGPVERHRYRTRSDEPSGKVVRCDFQQSSPDLGHGWVFRGQWQNAPCLGWSCRGLLFAQPGTISDRT